MVPSIARTGRGGQAGTRAGPPAHTNLGQALLANGQPQEAMTYLEQAVELEPGSAEAHNSLGAVLGTMGRLEEAIVHFRQALAIDSSHTGARQNLDLTLEIVAERPE